MYYSRPTMLVALGFVGTNANEVLTLPSESTNQYPDIHRGLQFYYPYFSCGPSSIRDWIESEIDPSESENKTVDPYFELMGVPPKSVDCDSSETDTCTTTVYLNISNSINISDTNVSITLDDFESYTVDEPCTRCDYRYPITHSVESMHSNEEGGYSAWLDGSHTLIDCQDLSCGDVSIIPFGFGDATDESTLAGKRCLPGDDGIIPESVHVCVSRSWYDSFSSSEVRWPGSVQCLQQTAKKVFVNEYVTGVKNVRRTEFIIEDSAGGDGDEDTLEVCQFIIDGTKCNSCRMCRDPDQIGYGMSGQEVDCSNIQEGLITSCDSIDDLLFGVVPVSGWSYYMLELKDGYVHTEAPTQAPTPTPTKSPVTSSPTSESAVTSSAVKGEENVGLGATLLALLPLMLSAWTVEVF